MKPPSTTMVCPVTQLAFGDARNSTTAATSSGFTMRPSAICASVPSYSAGSVVRRCSHVPPGNSMEPGATQLTRIRSAASVFAWLAV